MCSSNSPTLAALLSRKARWAARFWAFRFVGGVSVAGLRPGLGRGGMTHSLVVMDAGVSGAGESADAGMIEIDDADDIAGASGGDAAEAALGED
jgi:hypothetical protein